jgi:predicted tellurium resistance membrane protein TerC
MKASVDPPWWLIGVAVVLFVIGFYLEFTGKDGNSLPGAIIAAVGFLVLIAVYIVIFRRRRANR